MGDGITFFGDPHGDFRAFHEAVADGPPEVAIFVGDMGLERPFEDEARALLDAGSDLWWIVGNHDTDSILAHDCLYGSALADRDLGARVIEIGGLRIAGLGGIFRGRVWHPRDVSPIPRFRTRADFLQINRKDMWRGGLPRKQRSTIFPEDYDLLAGQTADVLVTHEAPSCHPFGFEVIDRLAEAMGVSMIVHGHHHMPYRDVLPSGIEVVCVPKAGLFHLPQPSPSAVHRSAP